MGESNLTTVQKALILKSDIDQALKAAFMVPGPVKEMISKMAGLMVEIAEGRK